MENTITIHVDFAGGLDLVFDNKTELNLELPVGSTVDTVIKELSNKHANYKKEMFAVNAVM